MTDEYPTVQTITQDGRQSERDFLDPNYGKISLTKWGENTRSGTPTGA